VRNTNKGHRGARKSRKIRIMFVLKKKGKCCELKEVAADE
jgi:hypothetical protein